MNSAFTEAFDDMLGIERVPADIYRKFYESAHENTYHENGMFLNHWNGCTLHEATGYAADDVQALIDFTLANHNYITEGIPRLKQLKDESRLKATPVKEFRAFTEQMMLNVLRGTQTAMQDEALHNLKHDSTWSLLDEVEQEKRLGTANRPIHNIIYANLSQPHRKVQADVWAAKHQKFFGFVRRFRDWMEIMGLQWSLRPISALNIGNREAFLSSNPMTGLPMPELWMRPAELEMSRAIWDLELSATLFQPMFDVEGPESLGAVNRNEFLWWDSKAAFAIAQLEQGEFIAVAPSALPPWLLDDVIQLVPIILDEPRYGGAYKVHGYHYQMIHPNVILDGTWPMFTPRTSVKDYEFIADSLHLICVGMSLWSSQIKLGRGHQRMSWTDSPMNASVCVWFAEALERLTTRLAEENV